MATNLDANLLAQLLAMYRGDGQRVERGGYSLIPRGTYTGGDGGSNGWAADRIYRAAGKAPDGVELTDVWDSSGNYLGQDTDTGNDSNDLLRNLILGSLGMYYGVGALNGAGGAAAGAGTGGAELTGWDAAMADLAQSGGITAGDMAAGGAVAGAGTAAGGATAGTAAGGATGGLLDAAKGAGTWALNNGGTLATLGGAVAGAMDGQDKTETTSRDPWAPAQPFLRGLLDQGQQLQRRYAQQPFSSGQRTAYANQDGLMNAINAAAPGLLEGMQANAGGANQFVRGQRNRIIGSNPAWSWTPGLLNSLGGM